MSKEKEKEVERNVIIVPVNVEDKFTESTCQCEFCAETHRVIKGWSGNIPSTNLQRTMLKKIQEIEQKYC
jgi:hypothetical protein